MMCTAKEALAGILRQWGRYTVKTYYYIIIEALCMQAFIFFPAAEAQAFKQGLRPTGETFIFYMSSIIIIKMGFYLEEGNTGILFIM